MKFQIVLIATLCAFAYALPIPDGEADIKPVEEAVKTINKVDEIVEEPKIDLIVEPQADDVKIEVAPEKPATVSDEIVVPVAAVEERKLDSEAVAAASEPEQSVEEKVADVKSAEVVEEEKPEEKALSSEVEAASSEEPTPKVEEVKADDAKVEDSNLDAIKEEIKTVEHIDDSVRQVRETEVKAEEAVKVAEEPAKEVTEVKFAPDVAPADKQFDDILAAVVSDSSASVAKPEVAAVPVIVEEKAAEAEKKSVEIPEEKKAEKEEPKVEAEPKKEIKEEKKEEPAKDDSDESIESHEHHDIPTSEESGESNDSKN